MKNAMKKLFCLCLAAMMLLTVMPFQAFADDAEDGWEIVELDEKEETVTTAASAADTSAADAEASGELGGGITVFRTLPDGVDIGDAAVLNYYVVDDDFDASNENYILKTVKTKVGNAIPSFPTEAQVLAQYAKLNGTSANKKLKGWYLDEAGTQSAVGQTVQDVEFAVYALVEDKTVSIKLDPKGGVLKPAEQYIDVLVGDVYPTLPVPTKSGYAFDGWYVKEAGVERLIEAGDDVFSTAVPYAKWVTGTYKVTLQRYNFDTDDWEAIPGFEDMDVPAGSTLSTANGLFPTDAQIKDLVTDQMPSEYTLKGWKYSASGADFKPGSSKITADGVIIRPRYQRSLYLIAQHPVNNTLARQTITVEIGKRIGELPAPNSWAGVGNDYDEENKSMTFAQWVSPAEDGTVISTRENLKDTSKHPEYYPSLSKAADGEGHADRYPDHFHAEWAESKVVVLYFHTNGNTSISKATKAICYDIPAEGSFDMHSLNLYKYFSDYGKYDDGVDIRDGWYDATGWANYCQGKAASTVCDELWNVSDTRNLQELHIMLTDKGTDANKYNNNNATADKSNYKTGDVIFVPVMAMALTGALLTAAYIFGKERFTR